MSGDLDSVEDPSPEQVAAIHAVLARPEIWDDPPPGIEDAILAAIGRETTDAGAPTTEPVSLAQHRARRRAPWWLSAAAVVAVVVAGLVVASRGSDPAPSATVIALSGTALAPDASASARISSTPAGLKIVLDTTGLPGADPGSYYEAWVTDGAIGFSAGTFHLRGGDDPIALWSGVDDPRFRTITVTLEPADGDTGSSGRVVLIGDFAVHDG